MEEWVTGDYWETACQGLRERELHCQEERGVGNRQPPVRTQTSACARTHPCISPDAPLPISLTTGNAIFREMQSIQHHTHTRGPSEPLRAILPLSVHVFCL